MAACRRTTRNLTVSTPVSYVYDNLNLMFQIAEQILGHKDSQENGTCATAFRLFDTSFDDLKTKDLLDTYNTAPELALEDILLPSEERAKLKTRLQHTVLRILIQYGNGRFARFAQDIDDCLPFTDDRIPIHQTSIHPLPAMDIDESSVTGNAQVIDAIFTETDPSYQSSRDSFAKIVRILWGDQLSVARLRSVIFSRAGQDSISNSFLNVACAPGLFHYQISATRAILETHWGDPHTWTQNPGSLCFHNILLDRKPIVLSSLPPYRTCRDLIFISLYARVFHCLELVSKCKNLDEYAATVTFPKLQEDAMEVVTKFTSTKTVTRLRRERAIESRNRDPKDETPGTKGDMVHENALLFLRDGLLLREFTDAIKAGDSGRVVTTLKQLALFYRGSGHTKYAYECFHVLHNLTHVWHSKLR